MSNPSHSRVRSHSRVQSSTLALQASTRARSLSGSCVDIPLPRLGKIKFLAQRCRIRHGKGASGEQYERRLEAGYEAEMLSGAKRKKGFLSIGPTAIKILISLKVFTLFNQQSTICNYEYIA